jgi:hypothetical protein
MGSLVRIEKEDEWRMMSEKREGERKKGICVLVSLA